MRQLRVGVGYIALTVALVMGSSGCGDSEPESPADASRGGGHPGGGARARRGESGDQGMAWGGGNPESSPAVPVEAATVMRRSISSYIETNGTLEAENEVDLLARTSGPIVELLVEEGDRVEKGQLLARIDDDEIRARIEISKVNLAEATLSYERAQQLRDDQLISPEEFEQAQTRFETAQAQLEGDRILMSYTEIRAPFGGLIVRRYIDFAQQVSPNTPLFRLSDFTPLLCPIQIPERDLAKVRLEQKAYLTFEAWPSEQFGASVLRISPVVDAATGTVKVTLEVDARGRLRPGMFARVFVETETRADTLVIPKAALSLESLGDTVYVADGDTASRREVSLGFREGDYVEILSGVSEGEKVVVVGQDGLSDGTPIRLLSAGEAGVPPARQAATSHQSTQQTGSPPPGRWPDLSKMTPEQLERAKEFMRSRGMSDEEIEARIERARAAQGTADQ